MTFSHLLMYRILSSCSCLPSFYLDRRPIAMWLSVLALAISQSCSIPSISFSLPIFCRLLVPTWVMMGSFFWHLRFLTCLVMSLILAPGLHKTFLLLCGPFLSQPFQVSCRGLTIESPTRNACSAVGVSECWSRSAENLLVSGILNLCDCVALLVRFADGLGYVVGLLCGVGSSGCCGHGVESSGRYLPFVVNLLLLVLKELLEAGLPGSVGSFDLTESAGPACTTVGGCGCTTVQGEGCGWVPLVVGDCDVRGWWRLGVLCVPLVGSVGHNWIPSTSPGTTPLVPCTTRGEVFGVPGACAWFTCFRSNATCSCRSLFCCYN